MVSLERWLSLKHQNSLTRITQQFTTMVTTRFRQFTRQFWVKICRFTITYHLTTLYKKSEQLTRNRRGMRHTLFRWTYLLKKSTHHSLLWLMKKWKTFHEQLNKRRQKTIYKFKKIIKKIQSVKRGDNLTSESGQSKKSQKLQSHLQKRESLRQTERKQVLKVIWNLRTEHNKQSLQRKQSNQWQFHLMTLQFQKRGRRKLKSVTRTGTKCTRQHQLFTRSLRQKKSVTKRGKLWQKLCMTCSTECHSTSVKRLSTHNLWLSSTYMMTSMQLR